MTILIQAAAAEAKDEDSSDGIDVDDPGVVNVSVVVVLLPRGAPEMRPILFEPGGEKSN